MRDIEFRGFNNEVGWVYGMYVDGYIVSEVVEANEEYITIGKWWPVDKDSVGQYTGLKDWQGNRIYEGDILKYGSELGGRRTMAKLLVRWSEVDGAFSFSGVRTDYAIRNGIVIGSIYQVQNLLGE